METASTTGSEASGAGRQKVLLSKPDAEPRDGTAKRPSVTRILTRGSIRRCDRPTAEHLSLAWLLLSI